MGWWILTKGQGAIVEAPGPRSNGAEVVLGIIICSWGMIKGGSDLFAQLLHSGRLTGARFFVVRLQESNFGRGKATLLSTTQCRASLRLCCDKVAKTSVKTLRYMIGAHGGITIWPQLLQLVEGLAVPISNKRCVAQASAEGAGKTLVLLPPLPSPC